MRGLAYAKPRHQSAIAILLVAVAFPGSWKAVEDWAQTEKSGSTAIEMTTRVVKAGCPIYLANFLIGLGLVVLAEAILWFPFYLILFGLPYHKIVDQEENFLRNKFGDEFERYCQAVPRWLPRLKYIGKALTFGSNFHVKEFGTTFGILVGAFFFEWIESPSHRIWITSLYHWLNNQL